MDQVSSDLRDWTERHRAAILRGFALHDADEKHPFDDIVRLTAQLMGKPMAFVSLIEEDRQWFLARHGVPMAETDLQSSICRHILNQDSVSIIEDTKNDARTATNPLCLSEMGVRFYAGAPLVAEAGGAIGALAVMDTAPGTLTSFQGEVLQMLARQVMAQLDLRKALRRSEMMRREVDHRVKNSLQSVASMTRIQARAVSSEEAREALENVSRRINTVAALNQQMYRTGSDRDAQMQPFMDSIVKLMRDSLPERITLDVVVDNIAMDSRKAGAVAVVVNEFVTNSAKHAFGDAPGTVSIRLDEVRAGIIELTLKDDGSGLGDSPPADGLGLAIIDSAIDQLNGAKTVLAPPGHGIRVLWRL